MGKFDKKLEGEQKLQGVKRKVCYLSLFALEFLNSRILLQFEPTESNQTKSTLAILSKLDGEAKRSKKDGDKDDVLNIRKAIRSQSRGRGGVALARDGGGGRGRGGKRGGKR